MALLTNSTIGLGLDNVKGRRRVPYPPTRISAFKTIFFLLCNVVAQKALLFEKWRTHNCSENDNSFFFYIKMKFFSKKKKHEHHEEKPREQCVSCKDIKSVDCFKCKGSGKLTSKDQQRGEGEAGRAEHVDEICPDCSGLKVQPCDKCSSKTMGELYGKLKQKAQDGHIDVPVLMRTSSLK
jgi:hypothetical protein